jgi:chromosome segregation ATPase
MRIGPGGGYDPYNPLDSAIANITKAIALAKEPELCMYRAKRAEMYHHKSNGYNGYESDSISSAEEDLNYIRNAMDAYPMNLKLSGPDRTYVESVYEKVAHKFEHYIEYSRLSQTIENLKDSMTERKRRGKYDYDNTEEADAYKSLSDLYLELFKLDGQPEQFEHAIENIGSAIERCSEMQYRHLHFEFLEKRVDMYIEAHEYEKAEREIASLRKKVSIYNNPDEIVSNALKAESIRDELVMIQLDFKPLEKQIAELNKQLKPVIEKKEELSTRQRKLTSQLNAIHKVTTDDKSASDELSRYVDTLEEKLASQLALRASISTKSSQKGGRARLAKRSPSLIRRGHRM